MSVPVSAIALGATTSVSVSVFVSVSGCVIASSVRGLPGRVMRPGALASLLLALCHWRTAVGERTSLELSRLQRVGGGRALSETGAELSLATALALARSPRALRARGDRPPKLVCEVPGDLVLGGLMMVHERGEARTCGPIMPQGGVQALEAMAFTLDYVNAHPTLLRGLKLGAHILDDCDKDTYGLEQSVDFIKGERRRSAGEPIPAASVARRPGGGGGGRGAGWGGGAGLAVRSERLFRWLTRVWRSLGRRAARWGALSCQQDIGE